MTEQKGLDMAEVREALRAIEEYERTALHFASEGTPPPTRAELNNPNGPWHQGYKR